MKYLFFLVLAECIEALLEYVSIGYPLKAQCTRSESLQLFASLGCDFQILEDSSHSVLSLSFVLACPDSPLEEDALL